MDTNLDQSYVQKMQYMSINNQSDNARYGRINTGKAEPATPNYYQKQSAMGAIENFASEGGKKNNDYTLYERNNIITSSKYATPKQVETIASQKVVEENDVYVQCAKPQVPVNSSPTHSASGSSQHSGSPRTSIASNAGPVYENIDYYSTRGNQQVYYPQRTPNDTTTYRKAQPQVPVGNRSNHDSESLPVYENIQNLSHKSTGAMPGPQVPASAPPPYTNNSGNYQYSQQPLYSVMQPLSTPKAQPQSPSFYQSNFKSPSKNLTQQQLDEINSSDYVCMTGNVAHTTLSTNTQFQTSSAKNYDRSIATGIAQTPTKVIPPDEPIKNSPVPQKVEKRPSPVPSPTPSTSSTSSGKLKMMGKNLLPYSVTPPKPRGPTEAEKKIEEMTRQIEEEMEKHEEEGEYFGKDYNSELINKKKTRIFFNFKCHANI